MKRIHGNLFAGLSTGLPLRLVVYGLWMGLVLLPSMANSAEKMRDTHENLNAVLWMQVSAEYQIITKSAFKHAARTLSEAMVDPFWTALPELTGTPYDTLPPAIIVDIDETLLDNSRALAQDVVDRASYDTTDTKWREWVNLKSAPAVPGAMAFLNWVHTTYPHITIYYITNRETPLKAATLENLKQLDFPISAHTDVLLTKDVGSESDKTKRRALVASKQRVLMLIGDDLNDFIPAKTSLETRITNAQKYAHFWGERWVMLPNPSYGSWERALPMGKDDDETLKKRFELLKTFR